MKTLTLPDFIRRVILIEFTDKDFTASDVALRICELLPQPDHWPTAAVHVDDFAVLPIAPSYRLAGQEFAVGVEQDGGRLLVVNVDPDANAIFAEPVLHVESPAAHAQGRVRADDKDGAADIQRS
jgi:hypothetical protein